MNRIGSVLQRFIIVFVVLSVVMPFGLSTTTANEATTEEQSVDQTSVQDVEGTTVIDDAGSDDETQSTSTPDQNPDDLDDEGTPEDTDGNQNPDDGIEEETPGSTESDQNPDGEIDDGTSESPEGDQTPDEGIDEETPEHTDSDQKPVAEIDDTTSLITANIESLAVEVTPAQPTVTGGSCVDGVYTSPSATMGPTTGVTYFDVRASSRTIFGQIVVDTYAYAELDNGYSWASTPGDGWLIERNGAATYFDTIVAGSHCEENDVVPAQPVVTGSTCVDGVYSPSSATFGPTMGVTYGGVDVNTRLSAEGQMVVSVSVSAWLADGYIWSANPGEGWQISSPQGAWYRGEYLAESPCGEVTLPQPIVTGDTCVDGVYTRPRATFGPTEHVTYSYLSIDEGTDRTYDVRVNATVDAGYVVAMPLSDGWASTSGWFRYSDTILMTPCEESEVAPAQPTVTGSTCVDGVYNPPNASFASSEGVTYRNVRAVARTNADGQVVVAIFAQADLRYGYSWTAELGQGWRYTGDSSRSFSDEIVAGSFCGTVVPAQPVVTGNTCVDGGYMPPSATFGATEHATYDLVSTRWELQDGRYVVFVGATATLADGYVWASDLGEGWARTDYSDDVRYSGGGQDTWNFCDAALMLAPPTITGNTCSDGVYTLPEATFGPTDHVRYGRVNITEGVNGAFVVTAEAMLDLGYNWAQDESPGWTLYTGKGSGNFYQGVFQRNLCGSETVVMPVDPTVTQAIRTDGGTVTSPSVTPATTAGITYTLDGDVAPGSTVAITATPNAGYSLGPAVGWTVQEDGSATFTVLLGAIQDETVTPVNPSVTQAVRTEAGAVIPPSVTPATTAGITYTLDGDVAPGSTVTVTATPNAGYTLGPAVGWTVHEDGSATFAVQLAAVPGQPTSTATATAPVTSSPTATATATAPVTSTATPTATSTPTATATQTPAGTPTATGTATATTVIPQNPTAIQAGRTDAGAVTPPSVIPATTAGITYTLDGDVVPGGIVTVTATPNVGYTLGPGTGWTILEDGTATFVVHLDAHPDAVEHDAAVTPEGAAYPVAPATTAARQDTDTTVTGAHVTALPNTGTGGEARGGHDAGVAMLSALTLMLAGITVGIRLRGQRA